MLFKGSAGVSARQQTARLHVTLESLRPTVRVSMKSGSSCVDKSDPWSPRIFHRHSLSEQVWMLPMPDQVVVVPGGHQSVLLYFGHLDCFLDRYEGKQDTGDSQDWSFLMRSAP